LERPVINIHDDLIARCRAGERDAYYKLYNLYSKAMYNTGYRITGNEDDAADVLQESFISAFKNLDSYKGSATFGSWLKKIVINKAINMLNKRRMEPLPEEGNWDVPQEEELELRDDETVEAVKRAIQQLPDGYRSVVSLYLVEGYDHQEIAEIMGITESTSKSQLNRGKGKLRELMLNKLSKS
jgi:RNA polymerase sigma factor (sigma-70 family)